MRITSSTTLAEITKPDIRVVTVDRDANMDVVYALPHNIAYVYAYESYSDWAYVARYAATWNINLIPPHVIILGHNQDIIRNARRDVAVPDSHDSATPVIITPDTTISEIQSIPASAKAVVLKNSPHSGAAWWENKLVSYLPWNISEVVINLGIDGSISEEALCWLPRTVKHIIFFSGQLATNKLILPYYIKAMMVSDEFLSNTNYQVIRQSTKSVIINSKEEIVERYSGEGSEPRSASSVTSSVTSSEKPEQPLMSQVPPFTGVGGTDYKKYFTLNEELRDYHGIVKVVLVGETGVGKSNLMLQFTNKEFQPVHDATIGLDFRVKIVSVGNIGMKLQMWDTSGMAMFRDMCNDYIMDVRPQSDQPTPGVTVVVVVCDVTKAGTMDELRAWVDRIRSMNPGLDTPIMLVGNKSDLPNRVVSQNDLQAFAEQNGLFWYMETSAKTGDGVEIAFAAIAQKCYVEGRFLPNQDVKPAAKKVQIAPASAVENLPDLPDDLVKGIESCSSVARLADLLNYCGSMHKRIHVIHRGISINIGTLMLERILGLPIDAEQSLRFLAILANEVTHRRLRFYTGWQDLVTKIIRRISAPVALTSDLGLTYLRDASVLTLLNTSATDTTAYHTKLSEKKDQTSISRLIVNMYKLRVRNLKEGTDDYDRYHRLSEELIEMWLGLRFNSLIDENGYKEYIRLRRYAQRRLLVLWNSTHPEPVSSRQSAVISPESYTKHVKIILRLFSFICESEFERARKLLLTSLILVNENNMNSTAELGNDHSKFLLGLRVLKIQVWTNRDLTLELIKFLRTGVPLHLFNYADSTELLALVDEMSKAIGLVDEPNHEMPVPSNSAPQPPQPIVAAEVNDVVVDPKYLEGEYIRDAITGDHSSSASTEWLNDPCITFSPVTLWDGKCPDYYTEIKTDYFEGSYLSLSENPRSRMSRVTFVLLGRKEEGLVPEESDDGCVVLIVPHWDQESARKWLAPNRDILVINSMQNVKSEQLGKPGARRIAAYAFAAWMGLNDFFMTDDNIKNIYVGLPSNWKSIYEFYRQCSNVTNIVCLGTATYDPKLDVGHPAATRAVVETGKVGAKLLFINRSVMKDKQILANVLFPEDVSLWGEDLFMHYVFASAGYNIGRLARNTLVIRRMQQARNSSKKAVSTANAWLDLEVPSHLPEFAKAAFERMKQLVINSIKHWETHQKKIAKIDLSSYSASTLERTSSTHTTAAILNLYPPRKKRRKMERQEHEAASATLVRLETKIDISSFNAKIQEILRAVSASSIGPFALTRNLYTCQVEAFRSIGRFIQAGKLLGYIEMATGSGKTHIFSKLAELVHHISASQNNVLIVTTRIDLVQQAFLALKKSHSEVSDTHSPHIAVSSQNVNIKLLRINDELKNGGKTVVCCANSLVRLLQSNPELILKFPYIIVDELHTFTQEQLEYLNDRATHGHLVLHFSATPGNKRQYCGERIFHYSVEEALRDEVIAPWIVDKLGCRFSEFDQFADSLPDRLQQRFHPMGGTLSEYQGLIFVPSVEIAEKLERVLVTRGLKAAAIHYRKVHKEDIIASFSNGSLKILIAVDMLKLGFDALVDYVILAGESYSEDIGIQILGRATRKVRTVLPVDKFKTSLTPSEFKSVEEGFFQKLPFQPLSGSSAAELLTDDGVDSMDVSEPVLAPDKKVAYFLHFDDVQLPSGFERPKGYHVPLDPDYILQDEIFAIEPAELPPSTIPESELVIIPTTRENSYEQALKLGFLYNLNNETSRQTFQTISEFTRDNSRLRNIIRQGEPIKDRDVNDSQRLSEVLNNMLVMLRRIVSTSDLRIQIFRYENSSYHLVKDSGMGTHPVRMFYAPRKNAATRQLYDHYDLLLPRR